jgi:(p)ppGpp synthase/HD superfamily hydrolase
MRNSKLLQQAIDFATKVHAEQLRKGKDVPYVSHVLAVGLIVSLVSDDENIIAAGILHDTIEDCTPPGSVTKESIAAAFNSEIAQMVDDVTEPSFAQGYERARQDKEETWMERKMAALEHIKNMQHNSQLVKSADVLHNLTELVQDLEVDGAKVWARFNASKENISTRYDLLILELAQAWPENPLLEDLQAAHQQLQTHI